MRATSHRLIALLIMVGCAMVLATPQAIRGACENPPCPTYGPTPTPGPDPTPMPNPCDVTGLNSSLPVCTPTPRPTPRCSEGYDDPCEGMDPDDNGTVRCCNGEKFVCVNPKFIPPQSPADGLVLQCLYLHESYHLNDSSMCSADGSAPFPTKCDQCRDECTAYKNQLSCLVTAFHQCASDPSCDPAQIIDDIDRIHGRVLDFCNSDVKAAADDQCARCPDPMPTPTPQPSATPYTGKDNPNV